MSLSSQIGASRSDELRSFRKSDLDDYAAMNADPEVLRYLGCEAEPWDRERASRHMAFSSGTAPNRCQPPRRRVNRESPRTEPLCILASVPKPPGGSRRGNPSILGGSSRCIQPSGHTCPGLFEKLTPKSVIREARRKATLPQRARLAGSSRAETPCGGLPLAASPKRPGRPRQTRRTLPIGRMFPGCIRVTRPTDTRKISGIGITRR